MPHVVGEFIVRCSEPIIESQRRFLVPDNAVVGSANHAGVGPPIKCTELNRWYDYYSSTRGEPDKLGGSYIFVRVPALAILLSGAVKLSKADVVDIGQAHGVRLVRGLTVDEMKRRLLSGHRCRLECSHTVYSFKGRLTERGTKKSAISGRGPKKVSRPVMDSAQRVSGDAAATGSGASSIQDGVRTEFPMRCPRQRRNEIIQDFQTFVDESNYVYEACAVCGQKKFPCDLTWAPIADIPLHVLQNEDVPEELQPVSYDFELYQGAYLCAAGMRNTDVLDDLKVCAPCLTSLAQGEQPLDAIANYQYYAFERLPPEIAKAFEASSMHERQLIAGCRASRITYIYSSPVTNPEGRDREHMTSQGFIKGNVAIFPQDVGKVGALVPPAPDEIDYCMCVVFMGGQPPTWEVLSKLSPVLVSRSRVEALTKFLADRNMYYRQYGLKFSKENLDALCATEHFRGDRGITTAVEVLHARHPGSVASAVSADYTDRPDDLSPENPVELRVIPDSLIYHGICPTVPEQMATLGNKFPRLSRAATCLSCHDLRA